MITTVLRRLHTAVGHEYSGYNSNSGPLSQRSAHTEQYAQTKTNTAVTLVLTLTDTGGAVLALMLGYRSLYITWQ